MPFNHTKTTFVRPLCEINNSGNAYKSFATPIQQFTVPENSTSHGSSRKRFGDNLSNMDEMKSKQLNSLNSVHSKLFAEVEEIQKWKTTVEMESRQKNKKVEELLQTIESQRKVVLELQLQNENLSYRLSEEIQQRSYVLENLHSTKELCTALKKHYNSLQKQFDYRNKIEVMFNTADTKRIRAIEDLKNKFEKICIEHSERIGDLNNALATETNKSLNLKEALEQQLSLYENEKESLCTLLNNSQNDIQKLSKEIEEEINKSRILFQEKRELEMSVLKLEKLNDAHLSRIKKMEENFKAIEEDKLEIEKKFLSENLQNTECKQKYKECLEAAEYFKMKSEENILTLNQTIENLESKCNDLIKKMEEEEYKNVTLTSSLQIAENDKCNLEKVISNANAELTSFEKLKNDYKDLEEHVSRLLEEKTELSIVLDNTQDKIEKCMSEKENASQLYNVKYEEFRKAIEDFETKVLLKEKELTDAKENNNELLFKLKSLQEDLMTKAELLIVKDEKIASLQVLLVENEKVLESVKSENVVLKDNVEIEKINVKDCLECKILEDKISELDALKAAMSKLNEELCMQKRETNDTLRMLYESERDYNDDRISKETELIKYKNQVRKLENDIKIKYVEREDFKVLNAENMKLRRDLEELEIKVQKLSCCDEKEAKKDNKSLKQVKEVNKENGSKVEKTRKKTRNTKFRNKNVKEKNSNSTHSESMSPKKSISSKPEPENLKDKETDLSSFDNCFDKIKTMASDKENKVWEVESSGSEYLDISFYKESEQVMKVAQKTPSPQIPNIRQTPLHGISSSQQKRESQAILPENILAKRPCGVPLKSQAQFNSSVWNQGIKTPEKINKNIFIAEQLMNKKNTPMTPVTAAHRRFFKTPLVERDSSSFHKFKKPQTKLPWF